MVIIFVYFMNLIILSICAIQTIEHFKHNISFMIRSFLSVFKDGCSQFDNGTGLFQVFFLDAIDNC